MADDEFTRGVLDVLLAEFPVMYVGQDDRMRTLTADYENPHVVIFEDEDGYDWDVADSLAGATRVVEDGYSGGHGPAWIIRLRDGARWVGAIRVQCMPKSFDIITPYEEGV